MSRPRQWRMPIAIGVLTLAGLVVALLGEGGAWWVSAWIALGIPLALAGWHMWRPR